ncbi:MAG: efflux RND transporter periplasmic adaptor subunit [Undibacterium curvum]|uniref:efflux RND transporter periplasmic adaptor subunit n=1 Tax=Undibacterium curvum TaxID=2762294 RepID=UPI003BE05F00
MHSHFLTVLASALLLTACAEDSAKPTLPPKPVKVEIAGGTALDSVDNLLGTLRARQRTDLGFDAAGRLIAVKVDIGDRVHAGQVLAQLDEAPARLRLLKAQADREAAAATLAERQTWLQQQQALARDGIISPAGLQAAQASHQQALSQHAASEAALANARRDLSLTRITAPFDGEVAARLVQPFTDVSPGQAILQLESGRALEVVAQLPDFIANQIAPGAEAHAVSGVQQFPIRLERLSKRSDNGALVQAVFQVRQAPANLRSGGIVTLELPRKGGQAITLPASALIPGADAKGAKVFVIDGDKLQSRSVTTDGQLLAGGRLAVSGLRSGDSVVVAGTATLHDGQRVIAHRPASLLQGETK